jgi:hypothetical protein
MQLALATPVTLYGLANAAVLSAGGIGSLLAARLTFSKPVTIVGVAGLLVASSLALVVVKNVMVIILVQVVLAAEGVGVSMVFTRLLHDSLSSRVRLEQRPEWGPFPRSPLCSSRCSLEWSAKMSAFFTPDGWWLG